MRGRASRWGRAGGSRMRGVTWHESQWRSVSVQPLSMYSPSCEERSGSVRGKGKEVMKEDGFGREDFTDHCRSIVEL